MTGQRFAAFLDEMAPKARILFMSATFASNLNDLALYAKHLGLVGPRQAFETFAELKSKLDTSSDAGALELLNAELVRARSLIQRQLSYEGVTFQTRRAALTDELETLLSDSRSEK